MLKSYPVTSSPAAPSPLLPLGFGTQPRTAASEFSPSGPSAARLEARLACPSRLLAHKNKGAAPRASLIGPSWSSERHSQSYGGVARPASQSGERHAPPAPGLAGPGSPEPKSPRSGSSR